MSKLPKVTNLTELAEFIGDLPLEQFDMTQTMCGSVGCIGGWASLFTGIPDTESGITRAVQILAPETSYDEIHKLCWLFGADEPYPDDNEDNPAWHATPSQAKRAIEILRDTGKCDWDRALEEGG